MSSSSLASSSFLEWYKLDLVARAFSRIRSCLQPLGGGHGTPILANALLVKPPTGVLNASMISLVSLLIAFSFILGSSAHFPPQTHLRH